MRNSKRTSRVILISHAPRILFALVGRHNGKAFSRVCLLLAKSNFYHQRCEAEGETGKAEQSASDCIETRKRLPPLKALLCLEITMLYIKSISIIEFIVIAYGIVFYSTHS